MDLYSALTEIYLAIKEIIYGDLATRVVPAGRAGAAKLPNWILAENLKMHLAEPGQWTMGMGGFGEILPYHENKITLDKNKKDKWGLNVLGHWCELKENERKMRKDMKNDAIEMLEAAGVKNVKGREGDGTIGRGIHEMGTARMGRSKNICVE